MTMDDTATELSFLLSQAKWIQVGGADFPEAPQGEVLVIDSKYSGQRAGFIDDDNTWVLLCSMGEDAEPLQIRTEVSAGLPTQFLALVYMQDEAHAVGRKEKLKSEPVVSSTFPDIEDDLKTALYFFTFVNWSAEGGDPEQLADLEDKSARAYWSVFIELED